MAAPAGQVLAGDPRRWLIMGVVLAGTFIAIVDVSIVNVAVPAIRRDLHASYGAVEFVVAAYVLAYGVLLITGGRLGHLYGRKRLFLTGLAIFTIASALCGLAPTVPLLIGARAVQGVGGALMYPQVLAIIRVTFSGADLNRALGIFGSVIGGGLRQLDPGTWAQAAPGASPGWPDNSPSHPAIEIVIYPDVIRFAAQTLRAHSASHDAAPRRTGHRQGTESATAKEMQ